VGDEQGESKEMITLMILMHFADSLLIRAEHKSYSRDHTTLVAARSRQSFLYRARAG